jgi:hypothetical protein
MGGDHAKTAQEHGNKTEEKMPACRTGRMAAGRTIKQAVRMTTDRHSPPFRHHRRRQKSYRKANIIQVTRHHIVQVAKGGHERLKKH